MKKWIPASGLDFRRNPKDFEGWQVRHSDSMEVLSYWLAAARIVPISAVEWKCSEGWHVGPRVVNDSTWFCFPRGRGTVTLHDENVSFDFGPGDLLLLPKGKRHTVRLKKGVHTTHYSVHFHAYVFGNMDLLDLLGFPCHVPWSGDSLFTEACARMTREYAVQTVAWQQLMSADVFGAIVYVLRTHGELFQRRGLSKKDLPRLLPALKMLEKQWNDPNLQVGSLAQAVSLSEVYFRKLFRRVTGMAPALFIQRWRIEQACILLRGTQSSIKQVADACGFQDMAFFYRAFHAWIGKTPGVYRSITEV